MVRELPVGGGHGRLRAALRPFVAVFLALGALVLPARAALAATLAHAPMCDEDASSVAAPIPALPSRTGVIAPQVPCDDARLGPFATPTPTNDAPQQPLSFERVDRVLPALFGFSHPKSATAPIARASRATLPSSHSLGVYRPPR